MALPIAGEPADLLRMAALWEALPAESRTMRRHAPDLQWSQTDYLLWRVEYQLRALAWGMADQKKRGPSPEPLKTPGQLAEAARRQASALANRANVDRILGMEAYDGD